MPIRLCMRTYKFVLSVSKFLHFGHEILVFIYIYIYIFSSHTSTNRVLWRVYITCVIICGRGKVTVIMNVASKWVMTSVNYAQLAELHRKYSPWLAVLAFPCNQFGNQEPGTSEEIKAFVRQYDIPYDLFEKVRWNEYTININFKLLLVTITRTLSNC